MMFPMFAASLQFLLWVLPLPSVSVENFCSSFRSYLVQGFFLKPSLIQSQ